MFLNLGIYTGTLWQIALEGLHRTKITYKLPNNRTSKPCTSSAEGLWVKHKHLGLAKGENIEPIRQKAYE